MARVVLPGVPHHITQRGIRRFDVFRDEADREMYLKLLRESCQRFHLRIAAYCLMTNHVHFVAIPGRSDSVGRTFHRCHGVYAKRFNSKYTLTGHLWQARPFSCALDEEHFRAAVRYVERNPVRACMVDRAEDYPWSSAAAHCGLREEALLAVDQTPAEETGSWSRWLEFNNDDEIDDAIRERTFTGRPCGTEAFVSSAEQSLGRQLKPKKPGPKPKVLLIENGPTLWVKDQIRR
jgi:putative transposase